MEAESNGLSESAIEVINVSKRFGATVAVRSLDLAIGESEFFSLLGPSGCGKTTLLRMIAGFETPTEGRLLIGGKDMRGVPPHKRPVNMVFQSYALFPHLPVAENVAFGLRSRGKIDGGAIKERVSEALNLVRLEKMIDRYPAQLSGGQQQRVALARAIVNRPRVLLLDEPLSALDAQIREEMQAELARLKNELNITFVMVTHDQDEALALSTRVAVFYNGNLEQIGEPRQIYEQPETPFVARFIGNTNLIAGTVSGGGGGFVDVRVSEGLQISVRGDGSLPAAGTPVWVSIKPQSLKIEKSSAEGDEGESNRFAARVVNKSYLGASTDFIVRTDFGHELKISGTIGNGSGASVGESVSVLLPREQCSYLIQGDNK